MDEVLECVKRRWKRRQKACARMSGGKGSDAGVRRRGGRPELTGQGDCAEVNVIESLV